MMSDDPPDWYLRAAQNRALREAAEFAPSRPNPLVLTEDERMARELRQAGRLN
jgi:hypothetical protein